MSDKLTSLTGFGEGDPKPEKSDLGTRIMPGHKRRKTSVTHERDSGGVTVFFKRANYNRGASAKAKALSAKMGKKDDYAERRSVAKHELKSMVRNLPHDLKRKMSYRSHLRTHLLKENDPRKWEKYK